jgi:hypothetical protein
MFDRKILSKAVVTACVLVIAVFFVSTKSSAQQTPSDGEKATFARANKVYGPSKLINIVGLMGFYSTAAAELQNFGFEMPAGEKSTLPAAGR